MKRRISLLLAVVMILGTFSFTFAAEATPEEVAGEFLMDNDVIEGINGELKLEDNFRRQDMVVMISRLMGAADEAAEYPTDELTFTDFSDPYYRPIIAWAVAEELIEGHTDERFGFGEDVTAQQYATVLLRALGYNDEVAGDGYDEALELAADLGILGDYEFENDDAITRGEMFVMTFNALGVTMKDSDETLAEFLGIEMPEEDELEVVEVYADNLKEIIVELSNAKLADEEKLENTNNYRLSGNEIERVEVVGNDVLVEVKNTLKDGKEYELRIDDIDDDIDGKYKFVAEDNTIPSVEKVEFAQKYGIKIKTSEPINDIRSNNFLVDGKNVTMDVERYGRTIILTPYNGSFKEDAETLTVKGLKDFAGFKSIEEDFEIEIVKDEAAPEVVDAILKGDKVEVVFDKDIYNDSVGAYWNRSDVGNISYKLGRQDIYAYDAEKVDVDRIVYTFKDNEVPSRRDEVTIEGITNHSNVEIEETTIGLREVLDDIEPEIIEKKMTAKDTTARTATVKLYFDKEVEGVFKAGSDNEFDVKSHFTLYEDEVGTRYVSDQGYVKSAKYDVDKNGKDVKDVIVVELANLEIYNRKTNDLQYILEIENFTNTTSSRYKMFRDYYEFKFTTSSAFAISDATVTEKGKYETKITISFNSYLDRDLVEDATNYVFYYESTKNGYKKVSDDDLADLGGKAELVGNGLDVILTIPLGWEDLLDSYNGLRILDTIKTTGGTRLNKTYYFDLVTELFLDEGETAGEAHDAAVLVANAELNKVTASLVAYEAAGGKTTDEVYKEVTDAQKALKDLIDANSKDTKAIKEATADLTAALKALNDATAELNESNEEKALEDAITAANTELAKVEDALAAYIAAGGDETESVYKDVTDAEKLLRALIKGNDVDLIKDATTDLTTALTALDNAKNTLLLNAAKADLQAVIDRVDLTNASAPKVDDVVYTVSEDGHDVAQTEKWVTTTQVEALQTAVTNATTALGDADATVGSLEAAKDALVEAINTFTISAQYGKQV